MGQSPAIRVCVLVWLTILAAAVPVGAQTFFWTNSAGGAFATPANWTPAGPPNSLTHTAVFTLAGNYTVTSTGTPPAFGALRVHAGSINFNFNAGTITVGSAVFASGTVNLASTGTIVATNSISIGSGGGARVVVNTNSGLKTDGTLTVGDTGSATLQGGIINAQFVRIGGQSAGANGSVTGTSTLRAPIIEVGNPTGGDGSLLASNVEADLVHVASNGVLSGGLIRCPVTFEGRVSVSGTIQGAVSGSGSFAMIDGGNAESTVTNSGSSSISGGSMEGVFSNLGAATMSGGTLLVGMNNGTFASFNYTGGRIHGILANDGTLNLRPLAAVASLQINNSVSGTLALNGTAAINDGTINNQGAIRGTGTLQGFIQVFNSGTITPFGGSLVLDQGVTINNLPGGMIRNDPLTSLSIRNPAFSNQGNLEVNAGGGIDFAGPVGVSAGQRINMLGGVLFPRGNLTVNAGGAIVGYGQINTDPSFALNNSGSINFNGSAVLQTNLNNAAGGIITARNGTTIIYGDLTNAGTLITQNGTFIVANESGALTGTGAARVLGGGAVLASQIAQTKLSLEGSQLSPAIVSIRDSIDGGATSRVNELTIMPAGGGFGGAIDLADTAMVIDYAPGNSPIAQITALLQSGFAAGDWTGTGIQSHPAAADLAGRTALGFAEASDISAPPVVFGVPIDNSSVLIAYTLYGDANLDRAVNINDFALLAANFNTPAGWSRGDFNYDAVANISDFALLAANFNQTLPIDVPRGSVPEPVFVPAMAIIVMMRSRRRS